MIGLQTCNTCKGVLTGLCPHSLQHTSVVSEFWQLGLAPSSFMYLELVASFTYFMKQINWGYRCTWRYCVAVHFAENMASFMIASHDLWGPTSFSTKKHANCSRSVTCMITNTLISPDTSNSDGIHNLYMWDDTL